MDIHMEVTIAAGIFQEEACIRKLGFGGDRGESLSVD